MELHATEFERFMYKTKGVGDGKSELWLKDRGELAKYRDVDCRWPKTLRTAWKKRGYDSHRDAAVMMVPYCPFAPLLVSWRRQHHWRRQQQQRRLPHACLLSTTALRAAARIAQAAGWVSGALLVLLSRSPAVHRHLRACTGRRRWGREKRVKEIGQGKSAVYLVLN